MEMILDKVKLKTADEKPCKVTLSVLIPPEIVKEKKEKVAAQFQRMAQIPGFRTGKAPLEMVRQTYSEKINSEALDQLFKDVVPEILKEKSLHPIATPMVENVLYNGEENLSFNLIIERNPEFKVKNYKKLPVLKKVKKVSDQDIQKELDELRERNAQLVPSQSTQAVRTHFAVIDYEGMVDGSPVKELKAENQLVNLAAPQSIQGFAEGILGMEKGASKEIKVDFPKEYPNPAIAGKPVVFRVTLQDLKEKTVPALDDELAKDFELPSLEELKKKLGESLNSHLEKNAKTDLENQILDHLVKENQIPVPESMVEIQLSSLLERAKEIMAQQGVKAAPEGKNSELREKYRPMAERQVRISYLLSGIARQENLQAVDAELNAEMEKVKAKNPDRAGQVETYFKEHASQIFGQMTDDKVLKFLIENAKIKEVND